MASRAIPGLSGALTTAIADLQATDPAGHWNFDRIAVEVTALGTPLSSVYVRQLASGRDVAVSAMVMLNLATVLRKPLLYFLDPAAREAVDSAGREDAATVASILDQFRGLSPDQQEALLRRLSDRRM